tara:strand:+ start:50 stop:1108 length:1059 start_codon:yes stop_codon:yes gene_type:complete
MPLMNRLTKPLLKRVLIVLYSTFFIPISLIFSEEEEKKWKMRDSNNFFWDNRSKEIRETIRSKNDKISALENDLATKDLALSIQENKNVQLKKQIEELDKERKTLLRRVNIRDKEILGLQVRLKRISKDLKNSEFKIEKITNQTSDSFPSLINGANKKTEEKITSYILSNVSDSKKISTKTDVDETQNRKVFPNEIPKKIKNPNLDSFTQQEDLIFQAFSVNEQGAVTKAYLSEFFLTTKPLDTLLKNTGMESLSADDSKNIYETWAYAANDRKKYPQIASKIRTHLLESCYLRVRTDFDGIGKLDPIENGKYYLIGLVQIGSVGTVWEMPIIKKEQPINIQLSQRNSNWYR